MQYLNLQCSECSWIPLLLNFTAGFVCAGSFTYPATVGLIKMTCHIFPNSPLLLQAQSVSVRCYAFPVLGSPVNKPVNASVRYECCFVTLELSRRDRWRKVYLCVSVLLVWHNVLAHVGSSVSVHCCEHFYTYTPWIFINRNTVSLSLRHINPQLF